MTKNFDFSFFCENKKAKLALFCIKIKGNLFPEREFQISSKNLNAVPC